MFNARRYARLLESCKTEAQRQAFWADLREEVWDAGFATHEISFRQIFESFVPDGREALSYIDPKSSSEQFMRVMESVDTAAFANISGQLLFTRIMDEYRNPAFIGDRLVEVVPTDFKSEKYPGISDIGDEAEIVNEDAGYPTAGVTEEWVTTPETSKRGLIVEVTREAIFFDRTGVLMARAGNVGKSLGINREKRILQAALGIVNSYTRNGSTVIATYGDNSGTHDWDNLIASNALSDWTDVENALNAYDAVTDPNTGEPIVVMPNQLVVPTALSFTAQRIVGATELRTLTNSVTTTIGPNPLAGTRPGGTQAQYEILSNQWVASIVGNSTTWFTGDFRGGLKYMQNWPITNVVAPRNSEREFTHDVIFRTKSSEMGVPAWIQPRFVNKNTA